MSSSIDFDEVLKVVGEKGRYQTLLFIILCIPATFPVAFLAFSNVFTSATPEHWCKAPAEFGQLNLSQNELKELVIPFQVRNDGEKVFEKCLMYNVTKEVLLEASGDSYYNLSQLRTDLISDYGKWKDNFTSLVSNFSTTTCKQGWVYDTTFYDKTLVTESDLVCEDKWWPQMSTTMFFVGSLFGNVIFGWVADRWGRRISILLMIFLEVPIAIITAFFKNYTSHVVLRTLGGFFFPSLYQIPLVLGIEMMVPKQRTIAGLILCTLFAIALSFLALLAFLLRDWFKLSLAISVPYLLLFGYYWILPESPRWLLSKGRLDEAEKILEKIARHNGVTLPKKYLHLLQEKQLENNGVQSNGIISLDSLQPDSDILPNDKKLRALNCPIGNEPPNTDIETLLVPTFNKPDVILKNVGEQSKVRSIALQTDPVLVQEGNILDIFRYANIRKKFLLTTFIWVVNGVVYNTLSFNTSNLGVNDYLAFFIAAVVEIPSYVISYLFMEKWGRRYTLTFSLAVGSIGCIAYVFVPEKFLYVTVCLAMMAKFGIAAAFAVFYVYVGELIPTVIRSQAMGVASVVVSIGLLTPPLILQLGELSRVLPFIILGTLSTAACFASVFLPETLNTPMPQSLQDGENFGKDYRIFSKSKRRTAIDLK